MADSETTASSAAAASIPEGDAAATAADGGGNLEVPVSQVLSEMSQIQCGPTSFSVLMSCCQVRCLFPYVKLLLYVQMSCGCPCSHVVTLYL